MATKKTRSKSPPPPSPAAPPSEPVEEERAPLSGAASAKKARGRKKSICIYVSPEGLRKLEILSRVRGFPSASSIFEEGIHRLFAQDTLVKGHDLAPTNQPIRRSIFGDDDPTS